MTAGAVTVWRAQPIEPWMMVVIMLSATMMWIQRAETWWTWAGRMEA